MTDLNTVEKYAGNIILTSHFIVELYLYSEYKVEFTIFINAISAWISVTFNSMK